MDKENKILYNKIVNRYPSVRLPYGFSIPGIKF